MKIALLLPSAALVLAAVQPAGAHPVCTYVDPPGEVVVGHDPCEPDPTHICVTRFVSVNDEEVLVRTCVGI